VLLPYLTVYGRANTDPWKKSSKISGTKSSESVPPFVLVSQWISYSFNFSFRYRKRQLEISPPWDEDWKLDEEFFKDLVDWDNQHRESTFLRVVEKIKDATITCKPFMELIPYEPFPARALVLALSHFLHLGVVCFRYLSSSIFAI